MSTQAPLAYNVTHHYKFNLFFQLQKQNFIFAFFAVFISHLCKDIAYNNHSMINMFLNHLKNSLF